MKKLSIFAVVVLLLCGFGWGGATYLVGGRVESRYFGLLRQYGQWGPLTLSNQSYRRGFLGSRATTLLEIVLPQPSEGGDPGTQTVKLLFEHHLRHGPLLFGGEAPSAGLARIETRLARLSIEDEELDALLREIPELREALGTVAVGFDGSSNTLVRVPPFERQRDGALISWGGLTFGMDHAPRDGTLAGEMSLPSLTVRSVGAAMTWKEIRGRFDLAEVLPALYVGTSQAALDGIDIVLPGTDEGDRPVARLEGAEFVSDSRFEAGLVEVDQVVNLAGLTAGGEHYGPLNLDVEMRNLDGRALSDLQQQAREVYRQSGSFNPDQIAAELVPVYTRFFTRLMAGRPEMNVRRLHLATPLGEADGSFRIRLTGMPGAAPEDPAALLSALQYLDAALDVSLDKGLLRAILARQLEDSLRGTAALSSGADTSDEEIAEMVEGQVESQLAMWAAQDFIVWDGEKVRTSVAFRQGELTVNGRALPLSGG